jgi:Protein of unknown function (DUF3604)
MAKKVLTAALLILLASSGPALATDPWAEPLENVYYGDLHVHTHYSVDAFMFGSAEGRYVDEAGQYAQYCGRLDFYSVTDHAEMLTDTNYWSESIRAANHFSKIGEETPDENGDPSIVAFTGWEWTLSYKFGHKNVILKYDVPEKLPPSPIRARPGVQGYPKGIRKVVVSENGSIFSPDRLATLPIGMLHGYRHGDDDTTFLAPEPGDLFRLLREYCTENQTGCDARVIPHGNAWGAVPAMNTMWGPQLDPVNHDPKIQSIIEIYSGHGNSEEYSHFPPNYVYFKGGNEVPMEDCLEEDWGTLNKIGDKAIGVNTPYKILPECTRKCSEPNESYEPCCWKAGEIVKSRCVDQESSWCKEQVELAKEHSKPFPKMISPMALKNIKNEYRANPGKVGVKEWGACGQCLDCFQPAYNYRNHGSVQKALASAYFNEDNKPLHYNFGFIGSTDTHSAWPGSVKESKRQAEGNLGNGAMGPVQALIGDEISVSPGVGRGGGFLNPGGLAVILAEHRTRDDLWESFINKNIYSTSGPRIEVWARAVINNKVVRMGTQTTTSKNPTFHIKANGSFVEDDTCPYDDEPMIQTNFSREEFYRVCKNQCYRTTDERTAIDRVEVVKILQPMTLEESDMANLERSADNPEGLIMDPYDVIKVEGTQIETSWTDKKFIIEKEDRNVIYYFRIIQKPTPGYGCNPVAALKDDKVCDPLNPSPHETEKLSNPQDGADPVSLLNIEDNCYTDKSKPESYCEERAWTSPFYVTRGN